MKALLLFFTLLGILSLSLEDPCSAVQNPKSINDCADIYLENNYCCFVYEKLNGVLYKSKCEPRGIDEIGQTSQEIKGSLETGFSCTFPGGDFYDCFIGNSQKECSKNSNKIIGGNCCYDKKKQICSPKNYHFKDDTGNILCSCTSDSSFIKIFSLIFLLVLF